MSDIDELGRVQTQLKRLSKLQDMLKVKILAAYSNGEHVGDDYVLTIAGKVQERLNTALFKNECPSVYEQYTREIPYREVTTRKREQ
jgi:hypothetical protein